MLIGYGGAALAIHYVLKNKGFKNITIDLITSFSIVNRNNQNHLFDLEQDTSALADAQLAEGDIIFVSIRRTGSLHGSVNYYADIGFDVEMNKKPI